MAKMPTANILLNVTCPKCTAKPARPDLYPSHVGIGSDAACLELRKALGDSIEREAALRARIEDVEGMAMLLCVMMAVPYYKGDHQAYWARVPIGVQNYWREKARAVSAWLKEGK